MKKYYYKDITNAHYDEYPQGDTAYVTYSDHLQEIEFLKIKEHNLEQANKAALELIKELEIDVKDRAERVIDVVSENKILKEAVQEFVERVEKGEVKSKYTYNKFKNLLK